MSQELAIFNYEGFQVRTSELNEEIWFVALDVCTVLGTDSTQVRRLDDDEKGLHTIQTPGGNQKMTIINESGLYSLILTSRKPEARKFKKWVTSVVLPSIRKTGGYSVTTIPQSFSEALRLAADMAEQNQILAPKAAIHDRIANAAGWFCIRDAAKSLKISQQKLVAWLLAHSWMYRDNKGKLRGYSEKTKAGYISHKITPIPVEGEEDRVSTQAMLTPSGIIKLAGIFNVELEEI
jgi:prophage antirepressor-like protein